mmetsp:Transcript_21198/g.45992  ORF Transcript_21198/g.45992 Transcript_21198/m.45992 type:complete len:486 (-) Transcript_21198:168-1625(-)
MISSIATSSLTVVSTTSLVPTLRQRASRRTPSWFSSFVRRNHSHDNGNISLRVHVNQNMPSKLRSYRSNKRMGSASSNDSIKKTTEVPAAIMDIEEIHRDAILQKQSTYIDPHTDFTVFTELAHLKRGKCCGNKCRHCPYGWSNVRNAAGGFGTGDGNARATSGDREGTGRLVKRIMDGTYYEDDESSEDEISEDKEVSRASIEECSLTESTESSSTTTSHTSKSVVRGEGKGGSAGGTLTSKNVPYTRKGDAGTSQLFTGERRKKDDVLFEALGTVDELCSIVGVVYAELIASQEQRQSNILIEDSSKDDANSIRSIYGDLLEQLLDVMSRLFDVGSHIARPVPQNQQNNVPSGREKTNGFHSHHTELLEEWIDTMTDELPELTSFILPTGSPSSAQLHVARTVCRRAERRMVPLVQDEETVDPAALAYVNRLSDYFFTAARFVNFCEDRDEVQYRSGGERGLSNRGRTDSIFLRERVVVKLKK